MTVITAVMLGAAPFCLLWLWWRDIIRPGSPARAGVREIPGRVWPLMFCGGLLVLFSMPIGAQLAATVFGIGTGEHSLRAKGLIAIGTYGVGVLVAGAAVWFVRRSGAASGFAARWSDVPIGLAALALTFPVVTATSQASTVVYGLVTGSRPDAIAHGTLREIVNKQGDPWAWAVGVCAVVGAPVVEEVIYRFMVQGAILGATRRVWTSIVITSVIFGAIHIGSASWHALPALAVLGVGMGLAYEHTKRAGVPVVMHVGFNALNVALALMIR